MKWRMPWVTRIIYRNSELIKSFIQALLQRRSILCNYAFTHFEEFWAVSVEAFFELPQELKTYLPALYHSLCEVLNQDPLTEKKELPSTVRKSKIPSLFTGR